MSTMKTGEFENMNNQAVVLYDGACPVCSREIAHYRRRKGSERINWVDIRTDAKSLEQLQISPQDALAVFHVRDHDGHWHTGTSAFIYLWSQIRPYQFLATIVTRLRLTPLLDWGYDKFLKWRAWHECRNGNVCRKQG